MRGAIADASSEFFPLMQTDKGAVIPALKVRVVDILGLSLFAPHEMLKGMTRQLHEFSLRLGGKVYVFHFFPAVAAESIAVLFGLQAIVISTTAVRFSRKENSLSLITGGQ
jgi:hypothetical protein